MLDIISSTLKTQNINPVISDYRLSDPASITGLNIGCQIYKLRKTHLSPTAVIYGGESTVEIRGDGIGGRILETALAIAIEISGLDDVVVICSASDGKDGNSPAAGVIIDGSTYPQMVSAGLKPEASLRNNDSYTILSQFAQIIPEYPANSNLNDFVIVIFANRRNSE
jgi:glycerate-2-kinase